MFGTLARFLFSVKTSLNMLDQSKNFYFMIFCQTLLQKNALLAIAEYLSSIYKSLESEKDINFITVSSLNQVCYDRL